MLTGRRFDWGTHPSLFVAEQEQSCVVMYRLAKAAASRSHSVVASAAVVAALVYSGRHSPSGRNMSSPFPLREYGRGACTCCDGDTDRSGDADGRNRSTKLAATRLEDESTARGERENPPDDDEDGDDLKGMGIASGGVGATTGSGDGLVLGDEDVREGGGADAANAHTSPSPTAEEDNDEGRDTSSTPFSTKATPASMDPAEPGTHSAPTSAGGPSGQGADSIQEGPPLPTAANETVSQVTDGSGDDITGSGDAASATAAAIKSPTEDSLVPGEAVTSQLNTVENGDNDSKSSSSSGSKVNDKDAAPVTPASAERVKSDIFFNEMGKFYSFKKQNLTYTYLTNAAAPGVTSVDENKFATPEDKMAGRDAPTCSVSTAKSNEKNDFCIISYDSIGNILRRYNIIGQFAKKQKKDEENLLKVNSSNIFEAKELLEKADKYFKSAIDSRERQKIESEREFVNFLYHNIPLKRERNLQMMEMVKREQFVKQLQIYENERKTKLAKAREQKLQREREDLLEQQRLLEEQEAFDSFDGKDDGISSSGEVIKTLRDYFNEWEKNFRFTTKMSLFALLHKELNKYDKQKVIELYAKDIVTVAFNKKQKPENIRVFGKSLQLLFTYEQVLAPTRWLVYWALQQNYSVWNLLPACYESLEYLADDIDGGGQWSRRQIVNASDWWLRHPLSIDDNIKWLIRQQLQDDTLVQMAVKNYYDKVKAPAANIARNVAVNITNNKIFLEKVKFDISDYLFYMNNKNSKKIDRSSYKKSGNSILDVIKGNFSLMTDSKIKATIVGELKRSNYSGGSGHGDEKKMFANIVRQLVKGKRDIALNVREEFKDDVELHDLIQSHISKIQFSSLFNKTISNSGRGKSITSSSDNSAFIKIIETIANK